MNEAISQCKRQTLQHLRRIKGQLQTLEGYLENDRTCEDVAQLTTAIAKSFDSLRTKTLEGFIVEELLKGTLTEAEHAQITQILKLYKK